MTAVPQLNGSRTPAPTTRRRRCPLSDDANSRPDRCTSRHTHTHTARIVPAVAKCFEQMKKKGSDERDESFSICNDPLMTGLVN